MDIYRYTGNRTIFAVETYAIQIRRMGGFATVEIDGSTILLVTNHNVASSNYTWIGRR